MVTINPRANQEKHAGVSLALACCLDWLELLCFTDTRRDYGEVCEVGLGVIGDRLYCVVFTQRGDTMRIISLRKANSREIELYESQD
ncbi:MAG: BrnT family toxin [Candidatus Protistobacter heckmanni]|nr:BrnT family toxin [Candidatus Protistobacter heckmanni]